MRLPTAPDFSKTLKRFSNEDEPLRSILQTPTSQLSKFREAGGFSPLEASAFDEQMSWWKKSKAQKPEDDLLLVCAGSKPGRVPFAMTPRKSARRLVYEGNELRWVYKTKEGSRWMFRILMASEDAAEKLAEKLKKKEIYSLAPVDDIRTIVIFHSNYGKEPRWIGGDINLTEYNSEDFDFGGNNVYARKGVEQVAPRNPDKPVS